MRQGMSKVQVWHTTELYFMAIVKIMLNQVSSEIGRSTIFSVTTDGQICKGFTVKFLWLNKDQAWAIQTVLRKIGRFLDDF